MAGERILIVDGEILYRTLYNDLLSSEGYAVQLAENGQRALKASAKGRFDLAIVDQLLEGMQGLEVLHSLKEADPLLPVLISGAKDPQQALAALRAGAIDYLEKPFFGEEFLSMVDAILHRSRQMRGKVLSLSGDLGQLRILRILEKVQEAVQGISEEAALAGLLDLALEETGASRGALVWCEPGGDAFRVRIQKGLFPPHVSPPVLASGRGTVGAALSKGKPSILKKAMQGGPEDAFLGKGSTLVLPLTVGKGGVLGGIILADKSSGESFTRQDVYGLVPIASMLPMVSCAGRESGSGLGARGDDSVPPFPPRLLDQATLEALIEKEIKKSQRYRRDFCLVLIDLRRARDLAGAPRGVGSGDPPTALLEPLLDTIRAADITALMRSGEIGVLMPETNFQGAVAATWRIRHALRELAVFKEVFAASPSPVTFGIACFPEHGSTVSELLQRAQGPSRESPSRFEGLWEYIDRLLDDAKITSELMRSLSGDHEGSKEESAPASEEVDQPLPATEHGKAMQLVASWEDFEVFRRYIEENILERLAGEGVFYLGLQDITQLQPNLEGYHRMVENGTKIFVFEVEDREGWDPREMTPVATGDPALRDYAFLIYYGVSNCYALVGRQRGQEPMCGFFTISDLLVNEIRKKLNETYL